LKLALDGRGLHAAGALALLVAVVVAVYLGVARPVMDRHGFYRQSVESMEQRLRGYARLIASRPALEKQLQVLQRDRSAQQHFLAAKTPSLAATELRRRVKSVVQAAGGTLVSTQDVQAENGDVFPRVTLKVQMQGSTQALQGVLHALESQRPLLFVEDLRVRSREIRRRRTPRDRRNRRSKTTKTPVKLETRLTVGFELYGYLGASVGAG